MSKEMFTLKSSDGFLFVVDEAVVHQSVTLSPMVQDCAGREYPINNVTGKILNLVVEYCKNHVVVDGGDSSSSSSSGDALKKWDDKFITQMDLSTVYDLIMAANYLIIKGLFDLACQRVADVIAACKDHEEIRATLGIVSDYTAEEEAEVLKENDVVERGVLEVDVTLRPRWLGPVHTDEVHGDCFLPYHLFRSKTLSLFLYTIMFDDQDLSDVLLPGCPMLEELTVVHKTDFYPNYRISSQSIKKLTVFYCYDFGIDDGSRISFDAPSVVSLKYTDYALSEYQLVNLGSLVQAKLDISYSKKTIKRPDLSGLLVGISNVETLHLSPDSTDLISRCVKHGLVLPVFNNLVTLSFGSRNKRGWKLLPYLLKQSPKLGTLIIQGLDSYTGDVTIGLFQVKELHVVGYKGTAKELQHLKSLLAGTECIPKMQVEFPEDVVVDDAKMIQTRRDLFILVGVVSTDVAYFE
ncbi:unnamed protein product [Brassica napus]|uniref:(rape) hypothetical protein n=1 Tax=Brassica napus TaxID=3708 RepID=A0A816PJE8_BRANA|nr:unnamed protein product [Brassica napus]